MQTKILNDFNNMIDKRINFKTTSVSIKKIIYMNVF